jgi:hypothetical protein
MWILAKSFDEDGRADGLGLVLQAPIDWNTSREDARATRLG